MTVNGPPRPPLPDFSLKEPTISPDLSSSCLKFPVGCEGPARTHSGPGPEAWRRGEVTPPPVRYLCRSLCMNPNPGLGKDDGAACPEGVHSFREDKRNRWTWVDYYLPTDRMSERLKNQGGTWSLPGGRAHAQLLSLCHALTSKRSPLMSLFPLLVGSSWLPQEAAMGTLTRPGSHADWSRG